MKQKEKVAKHFSFLALTIMLLSLSQFSYSKTPPTLNNDIIFVVPDIEGDDFKNVIDETKDDESSVDALEDVSITKDDDGGVVITVPIKNDEGEYELVDIGYTEDGDNRTINIPGQGDLSIIVDKNGDYNFEITPEQIKNADNITCTVAINGNSKCTIKPFIKMVGSKVLTADQLVLDYKEGENLKVIGGQATNLKLTDKDSNTGFNKSEVDAGDTTIQVSFSKQGAPSNDSSILGLNNFINPGSTQNSILGAPEEFKNADYYQISLDTSKMVQTVTNPDDRSKSATRFAVKNGQGIQSNITFRNGEQSNLNIGLRTKDGIYFNSDPFSKNTVIIDSTAPVSLNYNLDGNKENPKASLSLLTDELDSQGNTSVLSIQDTTENGRTNNIQSFGQTGINISTTPILEGDKGDAKIDPNSPIAFEIMSKKIVADSKDSSGKNSLMVIEGVHAAGDLNKITGENNVQANANSFSFKESKNGVVKTEVELGNGIQYVLTETNDEKKQTAMTGNAYYNNGRTKVNLANGVLLESTDYKTKNPNQIVDGKFVQRNTVAMGNSGTVNDGENVVTVDGGFVFQEVKFFDNSSLMSYSGNEGHYNNKDYGVNLEDDFSIQSSSDKNGNLTQTRFQANTLTGKDKKNGDLFSLLNSDTYIGNIGKTNTGKDIMSVSHTSGVAQFKKGDGSQLLKSENLDIAAVDADTVKFGTIKADEINAKNKLLPSGGFQDQVKITGLDAAFYIDDSDPNKKIKNIMASANNLNATGVDYSVDMLAKDKDGNESEFKVIFMEEGPIKSYKIFAEDGGLVYISGQKKDGQVPEVVFNSITYYESDTFKEALGTKLSGKLVTLDSKDNKLQEFGLARIHGVESINGDYKQYSITDGSVSEFDYMKNQNTHLAVSNANYLETTDSEGRISKALQANNINAQMTTLDKETAIKGANINAAQADSIQYGTITFDEASHRKNLLSTGKLGDKIKMTGVKAVYYIDETDPDKKYQTAVVEIDNLNVKSADYSIDIVATNAEGKDEEFTVLLLEDGDERYVKVYAEDGSLVHVKVEGDGNKGNISDVLFKSIELFETKEFKQILGLELSGKVEKINETEDSVLGFSVARMEAVENLVDGTKQFSLTNTELNYRDNIKNSDSQIIASQANYSEFKNETGEGRAVHLDQTQVSHIAPEANANIEAKSLTLVDSVDADGKDNKYIKLVESNVTGTKDENSLNVRNLNTELSQVDKIKMGTLSFDETDIISGLTDNDSFKDRIKLKGVDAVFYIDDSNPDHKIKNVLVNLAGVNAVGVDYSVEIEAKNDQMINEKFSIFFMEDGTNKAFKVYSEEGNLLYISGQQKNQQLPDIVFKSIEYFETEDFTTLIGLDLKAELKTVDEKNNKLQQFSTVRFQAVESADGSFKQYTSDTGRLTETNNLKRTNTQLNYEKFQVTETNTLDFKQLTGEMTKGVIDFVELGKDGVSTKLEASLSVDKAIGSKIESREAGTIKMFNAQGVGLLAIDYDEMKKFSGNIGDISYYQDKYITSIDIKDLKNFKLEDLKSGAVFGADADRILRVVEKDENGKEISSYLLLNQAFFDYSDKDKGIKANFKIGVLEFLQDKLNDKNIFLKADLKGDISLKKGPVGAKLKVALKGENFSFDTNNYKSDDGTFTKNEVTIQTHGDKGRLDKLEVSAGLNFMPELVAVKAYGSKEGGKNLSISYANDKNLGKHYLKSKFIGGEKVKIKIGLGKSVSEKTQEGAEIDQVFTPKGQNLMNNLNIVSGLVSTQEVTDWLRISPDGMFTISSGEVGGFGLQVLYKDAEHFKFREDPAFNGQAEEAMSIGGAFTYTGDTGNETSAGLLLSGDSELTVESKKGDFYFAGVKQGDYARVPTTLNLFLKRVYSDGDGLYGGVFFDMSSSMIDEELINKNAEYFDGGRTAGKAGASVAYHNQINKVSSITFAAGANNNFSEPAVCVTYKNNSIDPIGDLAQGFVNIAHGIPFTGYKKSGLKIKRKTGAERAEIKRLEDEIDELKTRYHGARLLEKITRALDAAKKFLEDGAVVTEDNKAILDISAQDLDEFAKFEVDSGAAISLNSIADKIRESKVLADPNLSKDEKLQWKVKNIRQSMDRLAMHYERTNSYDIYDKYLTKYRRLAELGVPGRSIK